MTTGGLDPDQRAGLRLGLLSAGVAGLVVLVLPLAVLVRDQWSPLASLDSDLASSAHRAVVAHAWLLRAAQVLTNLGAPAAVEAVGALVAIVLLAKGYRRSALYLFVCIAGGYLLSTLGKFAVGRARPVFPDPVAHARGLSFPSGHAAGAATFWLSLAVLAAPRLPARRRGALLVGALIVGVVVAVTRVLLGVHYPTDVTAGLLLGWGWVVACTALFATWRTDQGANRDGKTGGGSPDQVLEEGLEQARSQGSSRRRRESEGS